MPINFWALLDQDIAHVFRNGPPEKNPREALEALLELAPQIFRDVNPPAANGGWVQDRWQNGGNFFNNLPNEPPAFPTLDQGDIEPIRINLKRRS